MSSQTLQEVELYLFAGAGQRFLLIDRNHDGRITPDERKQIRMQFMEKRRAPTAG